MTASSNPFLPEFETSAEAERYDKWFRDEVEASLRDPRPSIPHDDVFAEMDALMSANQAARNTP
ncbi:type II toxin-antitoxin system RelB family antitoxin [Caballeronia arvi]|uniref:type II toxin-antitoxin system RelB family antitoxin n=1 Tax=Caballeronia arvi TaxID=1777135 RepID=UPI000B35B9D9|nr:antitoxin [Caballeronia arvi]